MSIDRIRDEMAGAAEDGMIQTVGELVCLWAQLHPESAQAFYQEGKNLQGAIKAMSSLAYKRKGPASYGYLSLQDGIKCAFEYYGVKMDVEQLEELEQAFYGCKGRTKPAPRAAEKDPLDLDELLGAEV